MPSLPDNSTDWFDERIELYIDAELPEEERLVFVERMQSDSRLRQEVAFAEQVSLALAATRQPECPPMLVRRIEGIPNLAAAADRERSRVLRPVRVPRFMRTAVGIAAVAIMGLVLLRVPFAELYNGSLGSEVDPGAYSQAEVDAALLETKLALALVGDASRYAGTTVRDKVIRHSVVRPVNRGLSSVGYSSEEDQ